MTAKAQTLWKPKNTKDKLEISDDASNNRHRVCGVWNHGCFVLGHHYSISETLESFLVHPRLCHYLHRYYQHLWACLSYPESWWLWTVVINCYRVRKRLILICNLLFFGGLFLLRICFPDVTLTTPVWFCTAKLLEERIGFLNQNEFELWAMGRPNFQKSTATNSQNRIFY